MDNSERSEEIVMLAAAASGCAEEERTLLKTLCAAAEQEVTASLRAGVTPDECAMVYVCACAWMAAGALELSRCGDGIAAMRAGDVSVTLRNDREREERCRKLREQASRILAPYTAGDAFFFRGVKG